MNTHIDSVPHTHTHTHTHTHKHTHTHFSWDIYLLAETSRGSRGLWGRRAEGGRGSTCGHVLVCLVRSGATKRPGTQISCPLTSHCAEVGEVTRGSDLMGCFMGWRCCSARPLTSCLVTEEKTNICALFFFFSSGALNHWGQLALFQFIKWIWTFALWSRLVSTRVMSHPSQTDATSEETTRRERGRRKVSDSAFCWELFG